MTSTTSEYHHVQKGILRPILLIVTAGCLVGAAIQKGAPVPMAICLLTAVACAALSFAVGHLTIRDEGTALAVRFGPLPLFQKRIPYASMTGVEATRSSLLCGWGIHYTRKGWLWNIGGFDCVQITTRTGGCLIGTDDPQGLARLLRSKLPGPR